MNYSWKKNDYNTGTQLNVSNFEDLYPLLYFNLGYQADQTSRDPRQLMLRYTLNAASTVDFQLHAVVLYEKEVIDKMGDN